MSFHVPYCSISLKLNFIVKKFIPQKYISRLKQSRFIHEDKRNHTHKENMYVPKIK